MLKYLQEQLEQGFLFFSEAVEGHEGTSVKHLMCPCGEESPGLYSVFYKRAQNGKNTEWELHTEMLSSAEKRWIFHSLTKGQAHPQGCTNQNNSHD